MIAFGWQQISLEMKFLRGITDSTGLAALDRFLGRSLDPATILAGKKLVERQGTATALTRLP